jgi:hypothetical protein
MVNKVSQKGVARWRSCVVLAVVVAALGVGCSGGDADPIGDFESAGVHHVHCERTSDDHYTCHGGDQPVLTIHVERSAATGGWVESYTQTDLRDFLVELIYGSPGCNAPDC